MAATRKSYPLYKITQNMVLSTTQPVTLSVKNKGMPKVDMQESRPLVVLLEYMNAKAKHIQKISDIYLNWNYNVLQISLKPLQLLSPVKGSQVVAKNLADFLYDNELFTPLLVHGFSVGGYVWGETLVQFKNDLPRYQSVVDRIRGHIFDSPADIESIPTAFPAAVFPNRPLLRAMFSMCLRYHIKINHESATKHYIKSRETFTSCLVKAPTLLITSDADVLSSPASVCKAKDEILAGKLECKMKTFDISQHVMHFRVYPAEYISEIKQFMNKVGLDTPTELKSKL